MFISFDFFLMNLECCRVARVSHPQLSFLVYTGDIKVPVIVARVTTFDMVAHHSMTFMGRLRLHLIRISVWWK